MIIPFNKAPLTGNEEKYILKALKSSQISGNGDFTKKCQKWFENRLNRKSMLTPSCTASLEMSAILLDIKEGDEVIMPSYTFVSTANAFVLRGAKVVFIDIRPDTMNIDETKIEEAITAKTKAIVPVHYAGVACEMDTIMNIAKSYNLSVVEDAAQAMMSRYKDKDLGTIGDFGAYSFHETKNYTSAGEGGLLIVNSEKYYEIAEIIREKGTNRSKFFRGEVDKYSWIDIGSSYLMNDVSAAYLWGQLEKAEKIRDDRLKSWNRYYEGLKDLEDRGFIKLPYIPKYCLHNGHMFYIKVDNLKIRDSLLKYLKENGIFAVFHYIPLHSSIAGLKYGRFNGEDMYTTKESQKLLRLPIYYGISNSEIDYVIDKIKKFYL